MSNIVGNTNNSVSVQPNTAATTPAQPQNTSTSSAPFSGGGGVYDPSLYQTTPATTQTDPVSGGLPFANVFSNLTGQGLFGGVVAVVVVPLQNLGQFFGNLFSGLFGQNGSQPPDGAVVEDPYAAGAQDPYGAVVEDPYAEGVEDPYGAVAEDPYTAGGGGQLAGETIAEMPLQGDYPAPADDIVEHEQTAPAETVLADPQETDPVLNTTPDAATTAAEGINDQPASTETPDVEQMLDQLGIDENSGVSGLQQAIETARNNLMQTNADALTTIANGF